MSNQLVTFWIPYVVCITIVVVCIYVIMKAVFSDRADGRRRCPKCWYDMAYSVGMTCSECGHTARDEARLSHTRRHWSRAMLAIVLCVITILGVYWKTTDRGFFNSLPTSVLIMAMPIVDDASSRVFTTLSRRVMMHQVSEDQTIRIIERCIKGDWTSKPPDDNWINKYGGFLDVLKPILRGSRGGIELHDLEVQMLKIPARVDFDTRKTWIAGASARIRIQARNWWPRGHECRLRITNLDDPSDTRIITQKPIRFGPNGYVLLSQPLGLDTTELAYEVETFQRRNDIPDQEWKTVSTETIRIPIEVRDSLTNAIEGVSGELMDKQMQSVFGSVTKWTGGPQPVRFSILRNNTFTPEFNDVAVGVSVELLRDGQVARQLDLWWLGGESRNFGSYEHEVPYEDYDVLMSINQEDLEARWTLRVRSDPALAMRAGTAEMFWKGDFEVPLTLTLNPSDATPKQRNWWVEGEGEE